MIEIVRRVQTDHPVQQVAAYLSDFSTTAAWDPHTVSCERLDAGPLATGSEFENVQRVGPRRSTFRYRVRDYQPGRFIQLHSSGRLMSLTDTMRFEATPGGGTEVIYTALFELKGPLKLSEPLMRRSLGRLCDDGAAGIRRTLQQLPPQPAGG